MLEPLSLGFDGKVNGCLNTLQYGILQYEPHCEKTGLRGFRQGPNINRAVQPKKMARGLKFRI